MTDPLVAGMAQEMAQAVVWAFVTGVAAVLLPQWALVAFEWWIDRRNERIAVPRYVMTKTYRKQAGPGVRFER